MEMAAADSSGEGKQGVPSPSYEVSDEEGDDDEDEDECSWLGQGDVDDDDDDDDDDSEREGEDLESQEYCSVEESESDQDGDAEDVGYSDEDGDEREGEDLESQEYCSVEESESDQDGDAEDFGYSDEDDEYEPISEVQTIEDDEEMDGDLKESKPNDKELSDRVANLLQRNKKLDTLKLEECKAYLRKHKLMITGTKTTCIQRILEHWRLKDGNGERLYPKQSFIINCTGDVCKGDVVMFKQRVYNKFDKVSRRGKILGKRTIAGRVVKESYGEAKQQHTFTIEVLWSKGVKALPPMCTLLVKGRNLYRYKTFRQPWSNEAERSKVLDEKHKRGAMARNIRASAKCRRIGAGSKRQRSSFDSTQSQKKRSKKHSEGTSRRKGQAKRRSNGKHARTPTLLSKMHGKKPAAAGYKKSKAKTSAVRILKQGFCSKNKAKTRHIYHHKRNSVVAQEHGTGRIQDMNSRNHFGYFTHP